MTQVCAFNFADFCWLPIPARGGGGGEAINYFFKESNKKIPHSLFLTLEYKYQNEKCLAKEGVY